MQKDDITLIGAGLSGALLSIYLAKNGFRVKIFEQRPDIRKEKINAGRSINLALSARGFHALGEVELEEKIMEKAIPMKGRLLHSVEGHLQFIPYGHKPSEVIYSVSRAALNKILLDSAEHDYGVRIHFNQKCTDVNFSSNELTIEQQRTSAKTNLSFVRVIGTDGSASAVRTAIMNAGSSHYSKDDLEHGYKELTIPPAADGDFRLEKNALHIWPRKSFMLIALPNSDGSFTCTLFLPLRGATSFASLSNQEAVIRFFKAQFLDALHLMPTLVEDFFNHPTGHLATIKCDHWHYQDKACILGDAAHAIVPFFGQGINCGFEDCSILNECLTDFKEDWQNVFTDFEKRRKGNTDAIAELSLANYHEMRDHVAGPKFALKKQVEFALEDAYPDRFIPKYSMVSFHRVPYSTALSRGRLQEEILTELCKDIENLDDLDWPKAKTLLSSLESFS